MMDKLFETEEGNLLKISDKHRLGFDKGANLGITILNLNKANIFFQLSDEEIELFAFWLNKHFDLKLIPDFEKAKEHEELKIVAENRKKLIEADIDRMKTLNDMISRFKNTCRSIIEAEEIKGEVLSREARIQVKNLIEEADKIHD